MPKGRRAEGPMKGRSGARRAEQQAYGGGGGGGSSSSGGFILFVIVLLLDYLKEFERNLQNGPRRGSDYDGGFAPQ